MFNKYQSHSLTDLAEKLAELFTAKTANPMEPAWVVVQNNEVKEWLSLQVSRVNGIAGNIRFIFPSEFIWMIYRLKNSDVPKALPSDLNALHWTIFELLGKDRALSKDIPFVQETDIPSTKRFQLAGQIADVFDQYQVYRPDMIYNWKQRKFTTKNVDEQWQLKLWHRLESYWAENPDTNEIPSRAVAHNSVITWLSEGDDELLKSIPKEVFIFGISHLNKPFLEVITGISKHKNVHFFGRNIKLETSNEEVSALFETWQMPYNDQIDLLKELSGASYLQSETIGEQANTPPEIELHSCHGARREVEVLKDEALRFLDANPDLGPSDILILLPDADEYAPLLETHFNNTGDKGNLRLPLSRLYRNKTQLLEHSLVSLLGLLNSSFKPSKVIDILSLEPVKRRFNIKDNEIDLIEDWILKNRIYRGIGKSFNQAFSWQKGINQLVTGAVMQPGYLQSYEGLVPLVDLSSSDEISLMAKFSLFVHKLKSISDEISDEKTPEQWMALVEHMCKEMIFDVENENEEAGIFKNIKRLKDQIGYSIGHELIPFSIFRNWFKGQVDTNNSSSGRFGQGITVSTYIPYRSVPFKFIAILGLNEGVFPRRTVRPEFDLIHKDPQVGDRIQSEDDSYLFLEVLSSASERLHLSYRGQDLRSETDRLPSMLVQQLKDCMPVSIRVTRHRLHPFSKVYYLDNSDRAPQKPDRSYDQMQREVANKINSNSTERHGFKLSDIGSPDVFRNKDLSLNELNKFLCEPCKYILDSELGVNFNVYQNDIQDREIFDLRGLDKYKIDAILYEATHKSIPLKQIYDYVYTAGFLPDMLKGKMVFEEESKKTKLLIEEIKDLTRKDEISYELRLNMMGRNVYGKVNGIHDRSLILHRVGQRREAHEIEQWVLHNALLASDFPLEKSFYISFDKSGSVDINQIDTNSIDKNIFVELLNWYTKDTLLIDKVNFFPKTSKAYAKSVLKGEDEEKSIRKAYQAYTPGRFNPFAEGGEESNSLIWKGKDPFSRDSFKDNAMNYWGPYLKALEESNG